MLNTKNYELGCTVVEHSTLNPKLKGSTLASITENGRKWWQKLGPVL